MNNRKRKSFYTTYHELLVKSLYNNEHVCVYNGRFAKTIYSILVVLLEIFRREGERSL